MALAERRVVVERKRVDWHWHWQKMQGRGRECGGVLRTRGRSSIAGHEGNMREAVAIFMSPFPCVHRTKMFELIVLYLPT